MADKSDTKGKSVALEDGSDSSSSDYEDIPNILLHWTDDSQWDEESTEEEEETDPIIIAYHKHVCGILIREMEENREVRPYCADVFERRFREWKEENKQSEEQRKRMEEYDKRMMEERKKRQREHLRKVNPATDSGKSKKKKKNEGKWWK